MPKKKGSETFSIFGLCEAAAADYMISKGRLGPRIPVEQIPDSVLYNEYGQKARFAVIVPKDRLQEFENTIKEMRA